MDFQVTLSRTCGVRAALVGLAMILAGCATSEVGAPASENFVWPAPPDAPRISYVMSLSTEAKLKNAPETLRDKLLGKKEAEDGRALIKPYGVHADKDGRVFVTDTGLNRLVVFDLNLRQMAIWGDSGRGRLTTPIGVTSDSQGRIYVTDSSAKRVVVYNHDGAFLYASSADAGFERPTGIAVDERRGRIYVADSKRNVISVLDMTGHPVDEFGGSGAQPGLFNIPTNLGLDSQGRLYVVDSMNHRIQILGTDGNSLTSFGGHGDMSGNLSRPRGLGIDSDGNIYVVDAAFNNFQIFNNDGDLLLFVGAAGRDPGQFQMPAGAYIDANDRLYVVDQFNQRVQVFQYLKAQTVQP